MRAVKISIFGVSIGVLMFYLVSSGCTWITFTANDRLNDKVLLKSSVNVKTIYLEFPKPAKNPNEFIENFKSKLKDELESKGYRIVIAPSEADLITKFKIFCYEKQEGVLYFFLGLIPTPGIEGGPGIRNGIKVFIVYKTDKGRWRKTYRAYQYPYDSKSKTYLEKIVSAIIQDLNQLAIKK